MSVDIDCIFKKKKILLIYSIKQLTIIDNNIIYPIETQTQSDMRYDA